MRRLEFNADAALRSGERHRREDERYQVASGGRAEAQWALERLRKRRRRKQQVRRLRRKSETTFEVTAAGARHEEKPSETSPTTDNAHPQYRW